MTQKPASIGTYARVWHWLANPPSAAPAATILIRLMAGGVFFWEGILKFVYPNQGVGRFTKLGIPFPQLSADFVGTLEIVGGVLLILGLFTRFIAVPFIVEMIVAMLTTKIAMFLGTSPLPLPPVPPQTGFAAVLHEVRSEYAQLLTVTFLLVVGAGPWSLDALLRRRAERAVPGSNTRLVGTPDPADLSGAR
ncbi:DoxX family protein [Mycobacterium asiaticum]|uniref:DoxX family protein n=1 Tax=Mycobacterium asiaticum TaxID=1790 RepID=UPI000A4AF0E3|nr:DoxX family protein [Mycobacterium asiaticum]